MKGGQSLGFIMVDPHGTSEAWQFQGIYASLLLELLRDLRAALPRLLALKDSECLWMPSRDHATELLKAASLPSRVDALSATR